MRSVFVLGCNWAKLDILRQLKMLDYRVVGIDRDRDVEKNVDVLINRSISSEEIESAAYDAKCVVQSDQPVQQIYPVFVDTELGLPLAMRLDSVTYRIFSRHGLLDKHAQYRFLKKAGVPIPAWEVAQEGKDPSCEVMGSKPAVVKPRMGHAAAGVTRFHPTDSYSSEYIIQKAVTGIVMVVIVEITDDGGLKILGAFHQGKTFGGNRRPGYSLVTCSLTPSIARIVGQIQSALCGYSGSLLIELIIDEDEMPFVLEVTPMMPNFLYRKALGIELANSVSHGSLGFKKCSSKTGFTAGSWLYPKGADLLGHSIAKMAYPVSESNDSFVFLAPGGTALTDSYGTNRAVGIATVSGATRHEVLDSLVSLVQSLRVSTQSGKVFKLETFGIQDLS